jgi:trimeric autotransporter adhesin
MNRPNPIRTEALSLRKAISLSLVRRGFLTVSVVLASLTSSSMSRAVNPPPDGDYGNFNTAEGGNALFNLNVGIGNNNTALGSNALASDFGGSANTAVGSGALADTTNSNNTAVGFQSLLRNTTGGNNTAIGLNALLNNTTVSELTAVGTHALSNNISGAEDTAVGVNALLSNTHGFANTALGKNALAANSDGSWNVAVGDAALYQNTTGENNTGVGLRALFSNKDGIGNTALGHDALRGAVGSLSANRNTAVGDAALSGNDGGASNTAIGSDALSNNGTGSNNTGLGESALWHNHASGNIALGYHAGYNLTTGSNNIDIGANVLGNAGEANTIRIGKPGTQQKAFIAGIYAKTVASGIGVIVNSNGQLGTVQSSARFKEEIKPMDKASEAILALKPVTFRYKRDLDPDGVTQFGLTAEQVEEVCPDLIVRDEEGKLLTVRYEAVNAMLLNEFLKEHRKVEELEKQIEALTATVQKVSKQIETNKPVLQVAANDQ